MPDDRVADRFAGVAIPDHRGLALIGDPDRGDLLLGNPSLLETAFDHLLGISPDLGGVVFDPAGLGEDLLVLDLVDSDHLAAVVEEHRAGARGALIDGEHELVGHGFLLIVVVRQ